MREFYYGYHKASLSEAQLTLIADTAALHKGIYMLGKPVENVTGVETEDYIIDITQYGYGEDGYTSEQLQTHVSSLLANIPEDLPFAHEILISKAQGDELFRTLFKPVEVVI